MSDKNEKGYKRWAPWLTTVGFILAGLTIGIAATVAIVRAENKKRAEAEIAQQLARFAGQTPVNRQATSGAEGMITLPYDSFAELEIQPDRLYFIVFEEAGASGWLDFHPGTAFATQPTTEHVLLFSDGRELRESGKELNVSIVGKVDRLRIRAPAGNITRVSTWAKAP